MANAAQDIVSGMGKNITEGLDTIYETALTYSDIITATAQLLCGIAAFAYIGLRLWRSWAAGEQIDFFSMLRPFATGLLIVFFSGFVSCLDAIVMPVNYASEYVRDSAKETEAASKTKYEDAALAMRKMKADIEMNKAQEEKEQLGVWKSINRSLTELKDSVLGAFEQLSSVVFKLLIEITLAVVNVFTVAVVYFYKIYVVTAKIILVLIGPFTLALSIFPGFHSNLKGWAAQYLNVSLYIPICNIIGFVQSMVLSECLYETGAEAYSGINPAGGAEAMSAINGALTMTNVSTIILGIVALMLYAHVPTFASWLLRGDGSGGLASFFATSGAAVVSSASQNPGTMLPSLRTSANDGKPRKA